MIDRIYWKSGLCDLCLKDGSLLESRLKGIMEKGMWVRGIPTPEEAAKAKEIMAEWEREITAPCLVISADMEEVVICERHLAEAVATKSQFLGGPAGRSVSPTGPECVSGAYVTSPPGPKWADKFKPAGP